MKKIFISLIAALSFVSNTNAQESNENPTYVAPLPIICVDNEFVDEFFVGMLESGSIIQRITRSSKPKDTKLVEMYNIYDSKDNTVSLVMYTEKNDGNRAACIVFIGNTIFTGGSKDK